MSVEQQREQWAAWSRDAVKAFLIEAMELERRLPDRERIWHASGKRSSHPPIVRTRAEMDYAPDDTVVRLGLTSRQIMRLELAHQLLGRLDKRSQRIAVMRARRRPWSVVCRRERLSRGYAAKLHKQALEQLACAINFGEIWS